MDVLLGIIGLIIGVAIGLAGLRLYLFILPVWGFVTGFLVGAGGVTAIFGDGFLSSAFGFIVGIILGVVFALFSYLYWYVGVLFAAGTAGGILGATLFASFGIDSGWLLFFIGLAFATLFILGALLVNLPVYVVIVNTALAGSAIAIGGLLLILDKFDRQEIGTGALWQKIDDNLILWLLWLAAAAVGIVVQVAMIEKTALQIEKWTRARPTPAA